jgi:hypothetical protein
MLVADFDDMTLGAPHGFIDLLPDTAVDMQPRSTVGQSSMNTAV